MNSNGKKDVTGILDSVLKKPRGNESKQDNAAVKSNACDRRDIPEPEVTEKAKHRRFTIEYKAKIVREADACTESGQIGALLRREGLYSSHLSKWRRAYQVGALAGLRDDKRGRRRTKQPLEIENEQLKKQNAQLKKRLSKAEVIIDIQKKISSVLIDVPASDESEENN